VGGVWPIALKKLKGAAFTTPLVPKLLTQAMGRGVMVEVSSLYPIAGAI
jgi:hypothetical protein